MNTFITPNNQKLLWQTISQSPLFSDKPHKEEWFRNIVGQFYESNKLNTMISLKDINIATIKFMMTALKSEAPAPLPAYQPRTSEIPHTKQDLLNLRRNEFDEKLRNLENDHKTLLKRELPPEIDFRDKVEEGPIANIGDLIKMEIEKRNREINEYATRVPPQALPNIAIKPPPLAAAEPHKKTVSWSASNMVMNDSAQSSPGILVENLGVLRTGEILHSHSDGAQISPDYKQKIEELTSDIAGLKSDIEILKDQFSMLYRLHNANNRKFSIEEHLTVSEKNPMWGRDIFEGGSDAPADDAVAPTPEDVPEATSVATVETAVDVAHVAEIKAKIDTLTIEIPADDAVIVEDTVVPKAPRNRKKKKNSTSS